MDFQDLRIFARVAAVQNLSAVGSELGLTPGTISKRLQALEDELKVRLFERTTRSIRITDEGEKFLAHASRILDEIEQARASISESASKPKGRIKMAAPTSLGRRFIAPAICGFMRQYPEIEIQVDLTDRIVNLQEDGYDLAIRVGVLTESLLIRKRLAPDRQVIVASPEYLAAHGVPETLEDLAHHSCLSLCDSWQWTFNKDGREHSVRVNGRLRSNSGEILRHAALEGQGLFCTSELRVAHDLKRGSLVCVLTDYEMTSSSAIWALYQSPKHVLPKMRALLDYLAEWFRMPPAIDNDVAPAATPRPVVNGHKAIAAVPRPRIKRAAAGHLG